MSSQTLTQLQRATALCTLAAIIFWLFFQLSKLPYVGLANPFADDPYDFVGSLAVQAAVGLSVLTLARLVYQEQKGSSHQTRFILRGNLVVLASISLTLLTNFIAVLQNPGLLTSSVWGTAILVGLVIMTILTLAATLSWQSANGIINRQNEVIPSLAEAVQAVFFLMWLPVTQVLSSLPQVQARIAKINAEHFLNNLPLVRQFHPRWYPWRFMFIVGFAAGVFLLLIHFLEDGFAPDLVRTLAVSAIFLGVEMSAVLGGFILLGQFLGLRPPLIIGRIKL